MACRVLDLGRGSSHATRNRISGRQKFKGSLRAASKRQAHGQRPRAPSNRALASGRRPNFRRKGRRSPGEGCRVGPTHGQRNCGQLLSLDSCITRPRPRGSGTNAASTAPGLSASHRRSLQSSGCHRPRKSPPRGSAREGLHPAKWSGRGRVLSVQGAVENSGRQSQGGVPREPARPRARLEGVSCLGKRGDSIGAPVPAQPRRVRHVRLAPRAERRRGSAGGRQNLGGRLSGVLRVRGGVVLRRRVRARRLGPRAPANVPRPRFQDAHFQRRPGDGPGSEDAVLGGRRAVRRGQAAAPREAQARGRGRAPSVPSRAPRSGRGKDRVQTGLAGGLASSRCHVQRADPGSEAQHASATKGAFERCALRAVAKQDGEKNRPSRQNRGNCFHLGGLVRSNHCRSCAFKATRPRGENRARRQCS
mmetsp:Transcript_1986/g.4218  ORF Transcript_1986/g.4218 Transcript_1986/m.4218 type:complete len:420 (-) Transcript_1986:279-1538(-)